jgi:hypothetical protein
MTAGEEESFYIICVMCRYIAPDSVMPVAIPTEMKKEIVELICHESGLVSPHCFDQVAAKFSWISKTCTHSRAN